LKTGGVKERPASACGSYFVPAARLAAALIIILSGICVYLLKR
jgi:hypothetical protein